MGVMLQLFGFVDLLAKQNIRWSSLEAALTCSMAIAPSKSQFCKALLEEPTPSLKLWPGVQKSGSFSWVQFKINQTQLFFPWEKDKGAAVCSISEGLWQGVPVVAVSNQEPPALSRAEPAPASQHRVLGLSAGFNTAFSSSSRL